ncbi:MAG TPA: NAD-dependent epimerase/dehydratase family protein, partial [Chitinophagaceae bacterium]|nr:NAD-dependent epimerase/dehydratase family protein [Chitinophagaceae bacterium]
MATVLITGGTGMIGTVLSELLAGRGHDIIILTRNAKKKHQNPNISYAHWDVPSQVIDKDAVQRADHIIHLAGANVGDKRWTKKRKKEILESRTLTAALLVKALKETPNKVQSVISASATGWYGPDDAAIAKRGGFTESDPAHDDFLGQTCLQWEQSLEPVIGMGKRLVKLRTGIVLSNEG